MSNRSLLDELSLPRKKGFFNSRDGTPIYYEVRGEGRPLILCYGLVCRMDHWRHQVNYFLERYQIITFDYRGHHRSGSPKNDQNITLAWLTSDVEDLVKFLELKEAVVFGHSLGVTVSALYALLDPKVVKGLVLICGAVSNPFEGMFYTDRMNKLYQWAAKIYELAPSLMAQIWKKFTALNRFNFFLTSRLGFNPDLAEEQDVLGYMEGVNQTSTSTFFSLLKDYTSFDGRELIKKLKCPTLVVAGEDDCITPFELQAEVARLIPQGELERVAVGSHNAHADLPEVVNRRIDDFLERIHYT